MQAAKDIALTENETNIVDCAWKATGIVQGACARSSTRRRSRSDRPERGRRPAPRDSTGGTTTGDATGHDG